MISKSEVVGGIIIRRGNGSTRGKSNSMSLRPPQIPHDLTWVGVTATLYTRIRDLNCSNLMRYSGCSEIFVIFVCPSRKTRVEYLNLVITVCFQIISASTFVTHSTIQLYAV
jgi:hypothetical protein